MFCEAFCHFPDDYVGTSAFAVQALHLGPNEIEVLKWITKQFGVC